jgi:hypothetical protein
MGFIDGLQAKPNTLRGMYASAQNVLIEGVTIALRWRWCVMRIACHALIVRIDLERFERLAGVASNRILFRVMRAIAQKVAHAAGTIGLMLEVPGPVVTEPGFETQEKAENEYASE